ncbi:hypothetical protein LOD99_9648 [Oopsacas minuta]|uniref:Uncharacterized protein n=1 Tax=Oopsacas minuta TaxID=111878 RepID=A0AAV7KLW1_9METZ|nr:hypothetical protein LOD99_9648 [Oopsacas minuta]
MSASPPPIPQKFKTKSFNLIKTSIIEDSTINSSSKVTTSLDTSIFDQDNYCLELNNDNSYCFNTLNNYCLELKAEDQRLLQSLMCIREEILILKETAVIYEFSAGDSKRYPLVYRTSEENIQRIPSQQEIESILTSYLDINDSFVQNSVEFEIFSHFDIPALFDILGEFIVNYKLSTLSPPNSCSENINRLDDIAICDNEQLSQPFIQPPPVPEKTLKRQVASNSTLPTGTLSISKDPSNNQTLLCDPVLEKAWPRSKSFNSNAFLTHTRQSSMTLSDFYDHLHPLSSEDPKKCSNDLVCKPLHKLPTSKSNMDCKLSSLDSSPSFRHEIHENFSDMKFIRNPSDRNDNPSSTVIDTRDCQLIRAVSTPSIYSNSILPMKTSVAFNGEDSSNPEQPLQNIQSLNPNIPSIPSTKSKTPKRFFSKISRGLSSGFNKHNDKKSPIQKYSHSSCELDAFSDLCVDPNQNKEISLILGNSPKTNQLISPILSPLIEHPPPIPPKFNKSNADIAINLQQTWC